MSNNILYLYFKNACKGTTFCAHSQIKCTKTVFLCTIRWVLCTFPFLLFLTLSISTRYYQQKSVFLFCIVLAYSYLCTKIVK